MILEILAVEPGILDRLTAHESGHTLDLISRDVSKSRVVDVVAARMRPSPAPAPNLSLKNNPESSRRLSTGLAEVFAIGDQGRLNGNDFALLARSHSLSVEQVSAPLDRCWNLASSGRRGSQAFLDYLAAIKPADDGSGLVLDTGDFERGSVRRWSTHSAVSS